MFTTRNILRADYHINSFFAYESLIIAPFALHDISEAMKQVEKGSIELSVFMEKSVTGKPVRGSVDGSGQSVKTYGTSGKDSGRRYRSGSGAINS